MKRFAILITFAALLLSGCTKESRRASYSFTAEDGIIEDLLGSLKDYGFYEYRIDVVFAEYGEGHRIGYNQIDKVQDNKKYSFKAADRTEYITVRIDVTGKHDKLDDYEWIKYIGNVFFLTEGENTHITLNEDTMMTSVEPK